MKKRSGGRGGSAGNGRKRRKRSAKQWDDYDPHREAMQNEQQSERSEKRHPGPRSMMHQWKQQQQRVHSKRRQRFAQVDDVKSSQYQALQEQKKKRAEALCRTSADKRVERADEELENGAASDATSGEENDDSLQIPARSVFETFVNTFQAASAIEEENDDEGEEQTEEIMDDDDEDDADTNDDADEIDHENEEIDSAREKASHKTHALRLSQIKSDTNAERSDEDEEGDADDEKIEQSARDESFSDDTDPYRRRYVLSSFDERDAKQFDGLERKFKPVLAPATDDGNPCDGLEVAFKPGQSSDENVLHMFASNSHRYIRHRLLETWQAKGLDPARQFDACSFEMGLWNQMSIYQDVYFAAQTYENTEVLRRISAMHVLNHVIKSRDTVTRNNERLRKRKEKADEQEDDREYRDQGFCRATVLVLLPLRSSALRFVEMLLELLPSSVDTIHNKDRFLNEFGAGQDKQETDGSTSNSPDEEMKEWQRVFADGNNDDCFQLGISISRKALRFYSEYHHADIIVASPLGLRQQLGDDVVELEDASASVHADFLSSVEVCIVDSASLVLMQNVEHLRSILLATNRQPKEAPHADFSRIREWNLAFLAKYFRQTVLFSHGIEPVLNHLMNKCCYNINGMWKYTREYDGQRGTASISHVVPALQQVFQRIDAGIKHLTAQEEADLRFEYFKKHLFSPLLDHPKRHVLIFVPSYFDYVRLRNLFNDDMNRKLVRTVQCCEYTDTKQVSRARTSFYHGRCHVMLYTERFHFYHQYRIRGIHRIIWYGLPMMGEFYPEMLNAMAEYTPGSGAGEDVDGVVNEAKNSIALFTRLDLFRLERIVGKKRAARMCSSSAKMTTFMFR